MIAAFLPPAITLAIIGSASGLICIDSAFKDDRHLTAVSGIISIATLFFAVILLVVT